MSGAGLRRFVRSPEAVLVACGVLAWAAKPAVDAGAPRAFLTAAATLAGLAALGGAAARRLYRTPGWLDGGRAVLVVVALWQLPGVYAGLGGDGFEYYVFARSLLFDGDLDLANDFAGLGARPVSAPDGSVTSRVPIGQAVVWLPVLAATHVAARVAVALGAGVEADGFSVLYQSAATSANFVLALVGLLAVEALARKRWGPGPATLAVLGVWLASPLVFYMVANPSMSHAASAGLACLMVAAWFRARGSGRTRDWAAAGVLAGLLGLVRAQDAVLLLLPAADLALGGRSALRRLAAFAAGPVAAGGLQLAVWLSMYGPGFAGTVAEMNWVGTAGSEFWAVLVSPRHGLFTWTPVALVAAVGLVAFAWRETRLGLLALAGCALAVGVNGQLGDWWGSDAFGQRRLLCLTPFFVLGLGAALDAARRRPLVAPAACLLALALWNDQLASIYQADLVAGKGDPVTLDRLIPAQAETLHRRVLAAQPHLPSWLWVPLYDAVQGIWLDEPPRSLGGRVDVGRESTDLALGVLGDGWFAPETEGDVTLRRSKGRRAWLRVPIRTPADFVVTVRVRPEYDAAFSPEALGGPLLLGLEWNGASVDEQPLAPGWQDLALRLPAPAIRVGFNDAALVASTTPRDAVRGFHGRNAALAVDWIRFERR